jgi:hypothetical protein
MLRLGLVGLADAAMSACDDGDGGGDDDSDRVLLAYFSRAGENYWYGGRRDLRVGNTEVLA